MNKKWTLWAGLILILVVFILIWQFAPCHPALAGQRIYRHHRPRADLRGGLAAGPLRRQAQPQPRSGERAQHHRSAETVTLRLRISPCPNDTFMFDALLNGRIDTGGLHFDVEYRDIEALNRGVQAGDADVSKISCAVLPAVADRYALLDSGAALGRGNGPLLVRRAGDRSPIRRVAVPGSPHHGQRTDDAPFSPDYGAHAPALLADRRRRGAGRLRRRSADPRGAFRLPAAAVGTGRRPRTAVGTNDRASPAAGRHRGKRSLPEAVRRQVETLIRQSIEYAFAHPEASRAYIKEHAQELDDAVIDAHIALFVNDYSLSLGDEGRRAVEALTGIACAF